ncbi:MAG: hypothetical protein K6U07_04880 [Firmicutes bacterium]|nr:hypothetical protein [Bacillota bacterium]
MTTNYFESLIREAEKAKEKLTKAVELIRQRRGFVGVLWCGQTSCEDRLREETGGSPRVIPEEAVEGSCLVCGRPATALVYFARAY